MNTNDPKANLEAALAYLKIGQADLARDALEGALRQLPGEEKRAENTTYFEILVCLATLHISGDERRKAAELIEEGLERDSEHADLLFLKSLLLFDLREFDEVLILLTRYLVALGTPGAAERGYRYGNEEALREVFERLAPEAGRRAGKSAEVLALVRRLGQSLDSPGLGRMAGVLEEAVASA